MDKLVTVLEKGDVRQLCIQHQFYTRGDCKAYENMLDECGVIRTVSQLEHIAKDIVDHTSEDNEYLSSYEPFDEVLCCLLNICKTKIAVTRPQSSTGAVVIKSCSTRKRR